jgi:uncharacterized membrane protein YdjX (TVP38/TMEM64 family)/phosphatidylserine/phosphatidylglycerophosphate/cardiolipin synthase-like enzyme
VPEKTSSTTDKADDLLREGETVWKRVRPERAAVLVDAAAYYGVLREALLKARHSIFIVGWDIDSRTRIVGESGSADDDAPETLGDFLGHLSEQRDDLDVYVLPWDYSLLFLRERELLPMVALGWRTPEHVHVCVDSTAPVGSSHHQKLVVIDDSLAFCGGLDLTLRRWDTADHCVENPVRVDPAGASYAPYHDLQMIVDGNAAAALGKLARARWRTAAGSDAKPAANLTAPWPDQVTPDFERPNLGIARTCPPALDSDGVHEIEKLFFAAIGSAERTIYIENQYLHSKAIARALADQAEKHPDLEIVIVSNQDSGGMVEERTMGMGRRNFMAILQASPAADRIRVLRSVASDNGQSDEVHIHAKLEIIDNRLFHLGSANLNQRSMGLDTECDLAIEASNSDEGDRIAAMRNKMIAHHLGLSGDAFAETVARHGSLVAAVDAATRNDGHHFEPIDPNHPEPLFDEEIEASLANAADPKTPPAYAALSAAADLDESDSESDSGGIPIRVIVAVAAVIALVAVWYLTPAAELADIETLEPYFKELAASSWAPVAIPLIFVVASALFFPITILIALTGMTLGPILGFACAAAGSLISAALSFVIGTFLGKNGLRRIMGKRLNRLSKAVARKGILSVAGLRLLPVAPFTAINLIAGASHIRFSDFIFGTILGMAPGMALMVALGDRLREVWRNPSAENLTVLALIVAGWLALAFGLQYVISKRRKKQG